VGSITFSLNISSESFFIRKNTQEREIYRFQDMEGGENFAGNTV